MPFKSSRSPTVKVIRFLSLFSILLITGSLFVSESLGQSYTNARVVVRVIDASTGRGIPGARVTLTGVNVSASAITKQNGETDSMIARVEGNLSFKDVTAACSAAGYQSSSTSIRVMNRPSPQDATVFLTKKATSLPPPTPKHKVTVLGKVYERDTKNPIIMSGVTIAGSGFSSRDTTGREGKYSISGCPSDKQVTITCSATGYKRYRVVLPILGTITDYRHDIPLDKIFTITPDEPGESLIPLEPTIPRRYGTDPERFDEKTETKIMASEALTDLKYPLIADISGGIVALQRDLSVVLHDRNGEFRWKFPNSEDGMFPFRFNGRDISDDGSRIAAAGDFVMRFRDSQRDPIWSFDVEHTLGMFDCVAISGNSEYIVAGNREGCVYLFRGDEKGALYTDPGVGTAFGFHKPANVYRWKLEEEGSFIFSIDISRDGRYIVVGGSEGIYLLDRDVFMSQAEHDGSGGCDSFVTGTKVECVSISDDGGYIAANTNTEDGVGTLYVFGGGLGNPLLSHSFNSSMLPSSVISGSGLFIALGTNDEVCEFQREGSVVRKIWCAPKAGGQTIVDISGNGDYIYANEGVTSAGGRGGHVKRTYLYSKNYLAHDPHEDRAFRVYDTPSGGRAGVSMSEYGDIVVFTDREGVLQVEEVRPALLMDIDLDQDIVPIYSSTFKNKQHVRFFIANPGQAANATLEAQVFLPQVGFISAIPELAVTEEKYTTIDEAIADVGMDALGSYTVYGPKAVELSAHQDEDLRIEIKIRNIIGEWVEEWIEEKLGLPGWLASVVAEAAEDAAMVQTAAIGLAAMTIGELRCSNPEFTSRDLVGWMYVDVLLSAGSKDEFEDATGMEWDDVVGADGGINLPDFVPGGGGRPRPGDGEDLLELAYVAIEGQSLESGVSLDIGDLDHDITLTVINNSASEVTSIWAHVKKGDREIHLPQDPSIAAGGIAIWDNIPIVIQDDPNVPEEFELEVIIGSHDQADPNEDNNNIIGNVAFVQELEPAIIIFDPPVIVVDPPIPPVPPVANGIDLWPVVISIEGEHIQIPNPRDPPPILQKEPGDYALKIIVRNHGDQDLEEKATVSVNVDKWDDARNVYANYLPDPPEVYDIEGLPAGKEHKMTLDAIDFVAGKYRITVIADPKKLIEEGNEENNTLLGAVEFIAGGPPVPPEPAGEIDLLPEHIILTDAQGVKTNIEGTLVPPQPVALNPGKYTVTVVIKNQGDKNVDQDTTYRIEVDKLDDAGNRFNNFAFKMDDFDFLGAGGDLEFDLDLIDFEDGLYRVTATADFFNVIAESDEQNTFAGGLVQFGQAPPEAPEDDNGGEADDDDDVAGDDGQDGGDGADGVADDGGGGFGGWIRRLLPGYPEMAATPSTVRPWPVPPTEEEEVDVMEPEEAEEPLPPSVKHPIWPWILIALYIYCSLMLHIIAKKTATPKGWLAWIPPLSIYLMCKIAGKPGWWFWLFMIPIVNIIIGIIVWTEIAKARNKAGWLGVLMLVPIINLMIPGYLALSK